MSGYSGAEVMSVIRWYNTYEVILCLPSNTMVANGVGI